MICVKMQIHHFCHGGGHVSELETRSSYSKLKKDDRLFVSSAFWARIRPESFQLRPDLQLGSEQFTQTNYVNHKTTLHAQIFRAN